MRVPYGRTLEDVTEPILCALSRVISRLDPFFDVKPEQAYGEKQRRWNEKKKVKRAEARKQRRLEKT